MLAKGEKVTLEDIEKEIIRRDHQDTNRDLSPLKAAEDSIIIDTTDKTVQQVVEDIIILSKGGRHCFIIQFDLYKCSYTSPLRIKTYGLDNFPQNHAVIVYLNHKSMGSCNYRLSLKKANPFYGKGRAVL